MSLCYSLNDPCFGTSLSTKCDKAYSYRHRLKLTPKIEDFEVKSRNKDYKSGWKKTNLTHYKTNLKNNNNIFLVFKLL